MSVIDTPIPANAGALSSAHEPGLLPRTAGAARRSEHIPALDGIRGIAIILVLLHHFIPETGYGSGIGLALHKIGAAGWCGVDLFFVLSGFLITGILFDSKGAHRALFNFYGRRVLRLFPLQYGMLVAVLVIYTTIKPVNCLAPPEHRIWLWLYASNIIIAAKGWVLWSFDHYWSLAVEEQFYFVWPFIVLAFSRRTLIKLCIALIAIALIFRIRLLAAGADWIALYVLTPCRMDALALGGLIALLARGPGGLSAWAGMGRRSAIASAIALTALIVVRGGLSNHDAVITLVGFSLLAIFFGTVIGASTIRRGFTTTLFDRRILKSFGKYSYAIYIFQNPVGYMMTHSRYAYFFYETSYPTSALLFVALGTSISFALAWVSWHFYEQHFLKFKHYFR